MNADPVALSHKQTFAPGVEPAVDGCPGAPGVQGSPFSCGVPTTIGAFCQTTPYTTSDGKAVGTTVFVATHCNTHKPLPYCYQQVPYLQIGVSTTPDLFIEYLYAHDNDAITNRDISGPGKQMITNACFKDNWDGPFNFDPSWVNDGIGRPAAPLPSSTAPQVPAGM